MRADEIGMRISIIVVAGSWSRLLAAAALLISTHILGGCMVIRATDPGAPESQTGAASWYGEQYHGRTTASGERFNMNEFTAAHRTLPFGTRVEVKNLQNGRTVIVRINDRGPFVKGRIIDVSRAAAAKLEMVRAGVVSVELTVLD